MPSKEDSNEKSRLISEIDHLNNTLIDKHSKVEEITQDESFPNNDLVRKALEANQRTLEVLITLQELIDSFDAINQREVMTLKADIDAQNDVSSEDKRFEEDCLHSYKKSKSSFLFSLVVISSVLFSAIIFFNFLNVGLEGNLIPLAIATVAILVGLIANYIGMKNDKRLLDLSGSRYHLQIEIVSELSAQLKFLEEERQHLERVKTDLANSLKQYNRLQRSIMDCYEGQFNE
ncbi:hypothetical protein AB4248_23835 [Vibrio splendidus]